MKYKIALICIDIVFSVLMVRLLVRDVPFVCMWAIGCWTTIRTTEQYCDANSQAISSYFNSTINCAPKLIIWTWNFVNDTLQVGKVRHERS